MVVETKDVDTIDVTKSGIRVAIVDASQIVVNAKREQDKVTVMAYPMRVAEYPDRDSDGCDLVEYDLPLKLRVQ